MSENVFRILLYPLRIAAPVSAVWRVQGGALALAPGFNKNFKISEFPETVLHRISSYLVINNLILVSI